MSTTSDQRPRKGHPVQFAAHAPVSSIQPDDDHELMFTVEPSHGGKRLIDFRDLKPDSLARLFAEALQRATAVGGTIGVASTVVQYSNAIRKFFVYLGECCKEVAHAADLRSQHVDGFERWLQERGLHAIHCNTVLSKPINSLRIVAAHFPDLLDEELCRRLRYISVQSAGRSRPRDAYSPFVARQLRNAARKDIAVIRARFDNDKEAAPSKKWAVLDDLIKKDGVVSYSNLAFQALYRSRYHSGLATEKLIDDVHCRHYLLASDIVPFLVLLSLETGLEIECCKALTIDCLRNPAGNTIEISYMKRRARGAEWKGLRVRDEGPLSPGGLIRTIIQLTASGRLHLSSENLWLYFHTGALVSGIRHPRATLDVWVATHGIKDDDQKPLYLVLSRLRKTQKALWYLKTEGEVRDFAIGHTPEVAVRHYADIPALRHVHESAIADGLRDALSAALKPIVLTPEEEDHLRLGTYTAATSLLAEKLTGALDVQSDVWLASCADFHKSPFAQPGQPCPEPFWGCFECQNAVITARKLPAILLFLDFITEQRAALSETHWSAKFGRVWSRITSQILPAFPAAVIEEARQQKVFQEPGFYLPPEAAHT